MKISLNWIKQFTSIDMGIEDLVIKIGAQLGAVESVVDLGKKYQRIVVAQVVSCTKHPNADKLQVCTIDDGGITPDVNRDANGYVQVVCGAPNVRAGLLVAWLPPGSTVPSNSDTEPLVLGTRELRGVVSNGMLASSKELAIGDDHGGILELDTDAAPGSNFAHVYELDDYIIDIENKMFTHRPDCFGQLGVAREIAGISGQKFVSPKAYTAQQTLTNTKTRLQLKVKNGLSDVVPRFTAQVFEKVTIGPSPVTLQTYLARVGVRPINNIVDVTNYYMLLTGQPLHAYDYDKLAALNAQSGASLETRYSKKGETLKLLNGRELTFIDDTAIVITSGDTPVGVGGVMGGADTEVDQNTTNIVLECANFNMYAVRKTSMKYGLFTDAVTRFNKGQSALQCDRVLAWAGEDVARFSASEPGNAYDIGGDSVTAPKLIRVSATFINARLGLELSAEAMQTLLANVECTVELTDSQGELKITPPFWRTDLEIAEDIVEEIGRLHGFDHVPLALPKRHLTPVSPNPALAFKQRVREILAGAGANELLTYSFVHGNLLDKTGQNKELAFKLGNAISPDLQYYRMSLAPSLLDKIHANIKSGYSNFALFEINKTHNKLHASDDNGLPTEVTMLSLVYAADDKLKKPGAAYYQARLYLDYLAKSLGVALAYAPITKEPDFPVMKPYDMARSAIVSVKGTETVLGIVGEFKASVRTALKLPVYTAGFEVEPDVLHAAVPVTSGYQPLPRFPKVSQDISLKVPSGVSYAAVYQVLAEQLLAAPGLLTSLHPLDIFRRADTSAHTQMAFRFTVADYNKTLTSEAVNTMLEQAAAAAHKQLNAERI